MNILIISTEYAKRLRIGSMRPVEMSKYFVNNGHCVTVLLPGDYSQDFDADIYKSLSSKINIINIGNTKPDFSSANYSSKKKKALTIKKLAYKIIPYFIIRFLHTSKRDLKDKIWLEKSKKYIDKYLNINSFDIILSTAPMERATALAYYIKRKYNSKWVCDFRDIMMQSHNSYILNQRLKRHQNKYIKASDAVTLVSRDAATQIARTSSKDKIHFIPNGYDGELCEKNPKVTGELKFAYTGILYNGERVLSMLFDALSILINNNELSRENVIFNYAGKEGEIIKKQAKKYGFDDIIIDHGIISHTDSKKMQRSSDFLIIASWNTNINRGVIPAKIYEYMTAAKPIISVVSGDVPNAELSYMIEDMSLGCACEYINYSESLNKLINYLRLQIKSIKEKGELIYNPNYEKMEFYKRENTAKKMLELFNELLIEERNKNVCN